jgi:transposase
MECSVYLGEPAVLERAFTDYDDAVGMTIESEELISCAVDAQQELLEAFAIVRPQTFCTWSAAFATVFSVLFWRFSDGDRRRDAPWAQDCDLVDTYLSPATVARLAQQAATIVLDDLNRPLADSDYSGEEWIQDFNDFRDMASEWLDLLALAAERKQALAIAVWD